MALNRLTDSQIFIPRCHIGGGPEGHTLTINHVAHHMCAIDVKE